MDQVYSTDPVAIRITVVERYSGSTTAGETAVETDGGTVRETSYRITREIDISEVDWTSLTAAVERRRQGEAESADDLVSRFVKRMRRPLELSWFRREQAETQHEKIALAMCEQYGADTVVLNLERTLMSGALRSQISQKLTMSPIGGENTSDGRFFYVTEIWLPLLHLKVDSLRKALMAHVLLFMVAVLSVAVVLFCILYSISVLTLFLVRPAEVTIAATNDAAIGITLLLILVFLAGVFGSALKRIIRRLRRA
jgi:hypothetical protein